MKTFKFIEDNFTKDTCYLPYRNEVFVITKLGPEGHVYLNCISNKTLKVDNYLFHKDSLIEII